jgi:hypothetical protein
VLINYANSDTVIKHETWDYIHQYVDFWANYASYTGGGLRFDNLHSSNPDFIVYLTGKLKHNYPDLILIGEYFSSKEEFYKNVPNWQLNLILGNSWEYKSAPDLRKYLLEIHTHGGLKYFLPITTHDTGSPVQEYGSTDSTMARYVIYALMGTGQTGIVQGCETAIEKKIEFIGKNKTIIYGKGDYRIFFKRINDLLANETVFHEVGNIQFVDSGHPSVIAVLRSDIVGKSAWLVFSNLDIYNEAIVVINQRDFRLPFKRFKMINIMTGRELDISDMVFDFSIEACGTRVFRIKR